MNPFSMNSSPARRQLLAALNGLLWRRGCVILVRSLSAGSRVMSRLPSRTGLTPRMVERVTGLLEAAGLVTCGWQGQTRRALVCTLTLPGVRFVDLLEKTWGEDDTGARRDDHEAFVTGGRLLRGLIRRRGAFALLEKLEPGPFAPGAVSGAVSGLTPAQVTANLLFFERHGLVSRERMSRMTVCEYCLTAEGERLRTFLIGLGQLAVIMEKNGFTEGDYDPKRQHPEESSDTLSIVR